MNREIDIITYDNDSKVMVTIKESNGNITVHEYWYKNESNGLKLWKKEGK